MIVKNGKGASSINGVEQTGGAPAVALTGDAVEGDVSTGKTFYSNSASTKRTGTLVSTPNYAPTVAVGTLVENV